MNINFEQIKIYSKKELIRAFQIEVKQEGYFTQIKAKYTGNQKVRISKAIISRLNHGKHKDTPIYAESYNMLSQTEGTLKNPKQVTVFSDVGHYKLPQKEGYFTVYNMLMLLEQEYTLIAYSSSERFVGKIHFNKQEIILEQDLGNIVVNPGEEIVLEEIMMQTGADREELLEVLGKRLGNHHKRLHFEPIPTGWCSWYYYGPDVTQEDIYENMRSLQKNIPQFKYIQIDDGYQAYMGDYLTAADTFKHLPELIKQIKKQGFEPAIWVAPFIAEADSAIFKEHPEYFVKDEQGNPLPSNEVTFGGWRRGPWYMLDATHPQAKEHLKQTFRMMNQVWGIKYFKLDANMWGAMPFGERDDSSKTYVEAYRMGMKAILEGAGSESYILGCNAPMWPSIGVVHGMRISGDICRDWQSFKVLSEECFYRNWQHNRLWINDPDCIVLDNIDQVLIGPDGKERKSSSQITQGEFDYHRAHILASGGAVLSGDAIVNLSEEHIHILRKFSNLPDQAARFDDHTFTVGRQTQGRDQIISIFNRSEDEKIINVDLRGKYDVMDYWKDIYYGEDMMNLTVTVQPHSAVVLRGIEKEY